MAYDELGPYKYLLRMSIDAGVRDSHRDAVARLAEYDRRVRPRSCMTLEEFLRRRGQHLGDRRSPVRPPQHAAPAPAANHGALRHRPAEGRLADGRDRREAGEARARPRTPTTAGDIARRLAPVGNRHPPRSQAAVIVRVHPIRGGRMAPMPTLDEIRSASEELGVEFYFAQFVDMYARPSAKLIPAGISTTSSRTAQASQASPQARSARFRRPGHRGGPRPRELHAGALAAEPCRFACDVTVEGEQWPYCPAHDPAPASSRRRSHRDTSS